MKPMLAVDYDPEKVIFPLWVFPKIDGVRSVNLDGSLRARSLKSHKNRYITHLFSEDVFMGFDGEMAAQGETHPRLCSLTTSALSTIEGMPWIKWHLFDIVFEHTAELPYCERYAYLQEYLDGNVFNAFLHNTGIPKEHFNLVPYVEVSNMEELENAIVANEQKGYEGSILRDPHGKYKFGRCTVRENNYLRVKQFLDAEARVISLTEGQSNQNEAQVNELGLQYRSSEKSGMINSGVIGSLECELINDVLDNNGNLLFAKGLNITVSPGNMDAAMRKYYWDNPDNIINHIIKFKHFPKGIKDKPRFPTFIDFRAEEDLV